MSSTVHQTPCRASSSPAVHPICAAVLLAAALACGAAQAKPARDRVLAGPTTESDTADHAKGRILVMARAGLSDGALNRLLGEQGGGKARRIGRSDLRIVQVPDGLAASVLVKRLARHPHIKFAELDRRVALASTPNDPYLGSQWHLAKIGANSAWDSSQGAGIKIAIIDTGVDGSHPDLAARMVPGWNFYDNNDNTADVYGHGTAVAGTAAATLDNGAGVSSVAGRASIMPVRIASPDGYAYWSTIAQGITWAADNGARVANVSYAVTVSTAVLSAANYMKGKGGLVVIAAGNSGAIDTSSPTTAAITVSATNSSDARASWSSFGPVVALSAPGDGIWTTGRGGGYGAVSGTSFAAPVAAGVVGLMMAANGSLSAAEIESLLFSSAKDLGAAGRDNDFGWGRVDAAAAVRAALAATSSADTQPPSVSLSAPLGSATVGGLVPVDVIASDNRGVVRVELKVNGTLVASDTSAPFALSWNSAGVANGMASLVAVAVDAAGNSASSAAVSVNVANAAAADTAPPAVTVTGLTDGSWVPGLVAVRVSASDNAGSSGIRQTLLIDGVQVAAASGASLSYTWNARKATPGAHSVQAVAVDAAGNTTRKTLNVTR